MDNSDDDLDFIGLEINEYVEKPYQELKARKYKIKHVNSEGPIGEYLRKEGKLKTIFDHVEEGAQDTNKIVAKLINEIDMKNETLDELQYKYNEKTMSLRRMLEEKDMLHHAFFQKQKLSVCVVKGLIRRLQVPSRVQPSIH